MTKPVSSPGQRPPPGETSLRWNGAHPNSVIGRATPKARKEITRKMRSAREDDKALEYWAKYGCVSWGAGE